MPENKKKLSPEWEPVKNEIKKILLEQFGNHFETDVARMIEEITKEQEGPKLFNPSEEMEITSDETSTEEPNDNTVGVIPKVDFSSQQMYEILKRHAMTGRIRSAEDNIVDNAMTFKFVGPVTHGNSYSAMQRRIQNAFRQGAIRQNGGIPPGANEIIAFEARRPGEAEPVVVFFIPAILEDVEEHVDTSVVEDVEQ